MTSLAKLWLIACVAMLPACQGPGPVVDQRPDFLSKEHTASSVWLGTLRGTKLGTWGTAVIVGPRHLLTNAHVWSPSDSEEQPWLESELPAEQKLVLFDPAVPKHHVHKDGKDHHFTRPGFRTPTFRLVATGTPGFQDVCVDCGKLHPLNVNLHDWALIETDEPGWDPEDAVVIHPAARDPDWLIPDGTELFIAGFSSIFLKQGEEQDLRTALLSFIPQGPYILRGEARRTGGDGPELPQPFMTYEADWPPPEGHSGGGVYLWNAEQARLELLGVVNAWVPTRWNWKFQSWAFDFSFTTSESHDMFYAPVAPALSALEQAGE